MTKEEQEKTKQLARAVFEELIDSFYINDMESCFEAARRRETEKELFPGGLNFTTALAIFALIDVLAGLYTGKVQTTANDVASFMTKYFSKYNSFFSSQPQSVKFYEVFRHGLAHEWSPKHSAVGMTFEGGSPVGSVVAEGRKIPAINVPSLYALSILAIRDYRKDLENGKHLAEFQKRYDEQQARDRIEMERLLVDIEKWESSQSNEGGS